MIERSLARGVVPPRSFHRVHLPRGEKPEKEALLIHTYIPDGDLQVRRTGPGSRHGLGAQPGMRSLRIPAMASSQGDVRSSPMAYPAVRSLPKLPRPLRPEAEYLIVELPVRPVGDQAQSLVIALRSPATKRSSDLNRYSPDIHLPARTQQRPRASSLTQAGSGPARCRVPPRGRRGWRSARPG